MSHYSPQGIHLFHQVTFADTTNGRITAHLSQGINVVGQQQSAGTHTRRRQRRLGPGMATPHNNHIVTIGMKHLPSNCLS